MDIKSATAELSALQLKLSTIVDGAKASGRDLTSAEIAEVEAGSDRAFQLKAAIRGLKAAETMEQIARIDGDTVESVHGPHVVTNGGAKSGAKGFITPASIKAIAQAGVRPGIKALVAGGAEVTPVALDPKPLVIAQPNANRGILDVVPVTARDTRKYSYVRQTVRTNNAAVVAPGAQKPTSVFTVTNVDNELDVYVHLSEYVDTYLLEDNEFLETFLVSELHNGIFSKVTADAANAFATAPGAQTQAFTDTVADSLYLGASKSQELGYTPDSVLLTRAALDGIILAKDTTEQYLGNPYSIVNGELLIWGFLKPIVATGLPDNSAVVFDSTKVGISTDKAGIKTKVDATTRLDYNEARWLVEGRFAFDIMAPASIVRVATAGA